MEVVLRESFRHLTISQILMLKSYCRCCFFLKTGRFFIFLVYVFILINNLILILHQVEFIVMGGTFMALDDQYRDYFIRNLHDALSGHSSNTVDEAVRYYVNFVYIK